MFRLIVLLLALLANPAAASEDPGDRSAVLAAIEGWYAELAKLEAGYHYRYAAPGLIDASPAIEYADTASAALGPRIYTSLAARALQFSYEVTEVISDDTFAKAHVWERGYFYASAGAGTYELAASTIFVLEREATSGRWLVLAHRSDSVGIPESMKTDPLPDLREKWLEHTAGDVRNARHAK